MNEEKTAKLLDGGVAAAEKGGRSRISLHIADLKLKQQERADLPYARRLKCECGENLQVEGGDLASVWNAGRLAQV